MWTPVYNRGMTKNGLKTKKVWHSGKTFSFFIDQY